MYSEMTANFQIRVFGHGHNTRRHSVERIPPPRHNSALQYSHPYPFCVIIIIITKQLTAITESWVSDAGFLASDVETREVDRREDADVELHPHVHARRRLSTALQLHAEHCNINTRLDCASLNDSGCHNDQGRFI